ncbi:DUF1553 domain-containing protein [Schlesneria paludicola]|uniref:DUF1553 domain-containing protein n=1 Tax=Schlesneria paludicola TaxID=360056 RepID=UPI00029AD25F|nr:DUF1553 domain-containing protein [Schlesneria paludicola]
MFRARGFVCAIVCGIVVVGARLTPAADPIDPSQIEFFETKIRPVLVEQCYKCHNSAIRADSELAVDHRAALLKGGDGGAIIVPRNPAESRLLPILRHEVVGMNMPQDGAKLDDRVIADFEKWIAMGAPDPRDVPPSAEELAAATAWEQVLQKRKAWWSFQPIHDVAPPKLAENSWSVHPIDLFVLAKLREKGLKTSEAAESRVLVRRLYFALIGLPPTAEEVESWTARLEQPGGFELLVNHLLESPHFGERWARHWMDWIRYAETHGSEGDPTIENAWRYRDYLIRALNSGVSYDQLVREHIAGDLLEQPRLNPVLGINESMIGPAHWRMVFHGFAPTDPLDEKVRFIDDEINTFSKAFLGLTVACARCHDHKFDAISQRDYYALFGVLGSCRPGRNAINSTEELNRNREALAALKPKIRSSIADSWRVYVPQLHQRLLKDSSLWQKSDQPKHLLQHWALLQQDLSSGISFDDAWKRREAAWTADRERRAALLTHPRFRSWNLAQPADSASWFRAGVGLDEQPSPAGEFAVAAEGDRVLSAIYPAGVFTNKLTAKHAANFSSADVHLDDEYDLWVRVIGDGGSSIRYVVQDYPRDGTVFPVRKIAPEWQWQKFDLTYWNGDDFHLELATGPDAPVIVNNEPRSWFGISEAFVVKKGEPGPVTDSQEFLDPLFESAAQQPPRSLEELANRYVVALVTAVNAWRNQDLTDAQARMLDACLKQGLLPNQLEQLTTVKPLLSEYRRLEEAIVVPTRVPGVQETVARNQRLFERGNHKHPSDEVPRRFLEAIDATPYQTSQSGRRQLAEDLLRDDNPLARRVIVNRIWHHLFGRGIVATPDNFGRLGLPPTHPELLDHLATRFKSEGGSIKEMIRFAVTSKTWQLSSRPSEASQQIDPDNEYLSHAHLRRLEAEAIRDSLLSATQTLNQDLYGPPVDGRSARRSIYVRVARNSLDPFLRAFDFPEPFSAMGRRDVTNVPAQSLTMLNDQRLDELASAWADRLMAEVSTSDEARLNTMFLTALGRPALPDEIREFKSYLTTIKAERAQIATQVAMVRRQLEERKNAIQSLVESVRQRKLIEMKVNPDVGKQVAPRPIGRWQFDGDLHDVIGLAHGQLFGGASVENGFLSLNQQGYVITAPLTQSLKAKTLEIWVQLDGLNQRGGGAMTIQSRDGGTFDSIVFAEQNPQEWLSGSNNFARTQSFQAPPETDAGNRPVQVAIVYQNDGQVIGYREGQPYGKSYQSNGPQEFKAGEAIIGFGIRHLPAGGNRMLAGRILRAQLYDRALSAEEVLASSLAAPFFVSDAQIVAAMSEAERQQWNTDKRQLAVAEEKIKSWGTMVDATGEKSLWTDLARAMFLFQEFLFVK